MATSTPQSTPRLQSFRRIVVKIGSALLVDSARGRLKRTWLESLAEDLAAHAERGAEVLVVSSGAIALGRTLLGLPNPIQDVIVGLIIVAAVTVDQIRQRRLRSV